MSGFGQNETLRHILAYREKTQYDPKWGLLFWEMAMQAGEDKYCRSHQ